MYTGPKLTNENLVFGYDTGYGAADNTTATRFYPGETTTNLRSSTQTSGMINGMQGVTVTYVAEEDGWQKYSLSGTFSSGTYPYCMGVKNQSFTGGARHSTQLIIKTNVESKFNYFGTNGVSYVNQPKDHEGVNSSTVLPDGSKLLQRQGFAYTSTTTQTGYLWTNPVNNTTFSSSTDFIWVKDFQIEQNIHCTPHTTTSRSSTASLIDLKKTTDIDVSNVSFDSTGQPTFDGTSDSILVGTVGNYSNIMTVEAVFKTSSSASWKNILCGTSGDIIFTVNGSKLNFGSQGSSPIAHANYSTTNVNDGEWHYGVATYNGSQVKIYVDGVLESTNSRSGNQTPSSLRAGSNNAGTSEFFNGDIPLVKLYNRVLTAAEITNNYNAYKNRFNI
jgi:hypothetical protein